MNIPRDYKEASAFLGDKLSKNVKGKRATVIVRFDDSTIRLRYQGTTVAEFRNDGSVQVSSGGWRSKTTKDRINSAILGLGTVFQKNFEWFMFDYQRNTTVPFQDGMVVNKLAAFA